MDSKGLSLDDGMSRGVVNHTIAVSKYETLLPGEKTKWEPVYSYIKKGNDYVEFELLHYKKYIDIPRREAE